MVRLDPAQSFTPKVEAEFGKENVIVIKDALGAQPIRRWYKEWSSLTGKKPKLTGDLYDSLMNKVDSAYRNKKIATVTFIWMQGERDAKEQYGAEYGKSPLGLYDQLSEDLERQDINFVIGRLNDFDMSNKKWPDWTLVRNSQVAESHPRFTWINTDDLNDGCSRNGKKIENDLHMSNEGYRKLGARFADAAIKLIHYN